MMIFKVFVAFGKILSAEGRILQHFEKLEEFTRMVFTFTVGKHAAASLGNSLGGKPVPGQKTPLSGTSRAELAIYGATRNRF